MNMRGRWGRGSVISIVLVSLREGKEVKLTSLQRKMAESQLQEIRTQVVAGALHVPRPFRYEIPSCIRSGSAPLQFQPAMGRQRKVLLLRLAEAAVWREETTSVELTSG